jgi:hypothetical protein
MLEVITETLIDSIKILPFLFLSYLLIEYIEHKSSQKIEKVLSTSGKYSKVIGSVLGIIPQCGFSAVAANLFSGRVITIGTLVAVFLATSDEAIPILITYPDKAKYLLLILGIKLIIAIVAGTLIDAILNLKKNRKAKYNEDEMHEHMHEICKDCDCENGILKSSIKHTLSIFLFLLVISFVINIAVELIGEKNFENIILSGSIFQPFVASIIGLIPNCAASVLLSKLFVDGSLSIGSIIAGLSTGAGVGGIILFKTNKNMKENISILGLVYLIGAFCGILIDCIMRII